MKVKICGITDDQTAHIATCAGADAIGFVFAESKRQIDVEKAKQISKTIPSNILKIGVFVNETKKKMESIYEEVGLTHLQLHGDETPEFCQTLKYPVIKAMRIEEESDIHQIERFNCCDFILVDSPYGKYRGGNGTTFDWNLLLNKSILNEKLIVAGGLTTENVHEAIKLTKPFMLDVSSGVETDGKKDAEKIKAFIKKAKIGGM